MEPGYKTHRMDRRRHSWGEGAQVSEGLQMPRGGRVLHPKLSPTWPKRAAGQDVAGRHCGHRGVKWALSAHAESLKAAGGLCGTTQHICSVWGVLLKSVSRDFKNIVVVRIFCLFHWAPWRGRMGGYQEGTPATAPSAAGLTRLPRVPSCPRCGAPPGVGLAGTLPRSGWLRV